MWVSGDTIFIEKVFEMGAGTARVNEVDPATGRSKADDIIEYCSQPRTIMELSELLNCKWHVTTHRCYLGPLIEQGLLRKIEGSRKTKTPSLYVDARVAV